MIESLNTGNEEVSRKRGSQDVGGRAINDSKNVLAPGHIYACFPIAVSESVVDTVLFEK